MSQKSHGHICPKKIFLYCFPITAITNFHKLSGLKKPTRSGDQKSQMGLSGLKITVLTRLNSSGGS